MMDDFYGIRDENFLILRFSANFSGGCEKNKIIFIRFWVKILSGEFLVRMIFDAYQSLLSAVHAMEFNKL
jgi:hypothetical protein